ncbi:MAG: DNA polymerase Y family protein [Candidatus Levyibacteriota bacterium]
METLINHDKPMLMHIDLNSCFATIEQQANPLLRGKPLVVAAYSTPNAFILAPSIEAKVLGIKMGMRVRDAQAISSRVVVRSPDPPKYRDVHKKFRKIFDSYSPDVTPKSIDEAIIDFRPMKNLNPDLVSIAKEIKARMKSEIGEWIRCSIGISTNMFLAKLGASLHKPDGLTVIDHTNLLEIYKNTELLDFCGINVRYKVRLNIGGIHTPLEFFHATSEHLEKRVFRSVLGRYWFKKMRGFEADQKDFPTKSIGHQYALQKPTDDPQILARLIMKLCEKMGRRVRKKGYIAHGIHMWFSYRDRTSWHRGRLVNSNLYTTLDLYRHAMSICNAQPEQKVITHMGVSCYHLTEYNNNQLSLFEEESVKAKNVATAADKLNDIYGEFTVVPGLMMNMDSTILDRIAFGGIRDMENFF